MNIDDPFASDLSNFDSIVAALESNVDKQHTNISSTSTNNSEFHRIRGTTNSATKASSTSFPASMNTTLSRNTPAAVSVNGSASLSLPTGPNRVPPTTTTITSTVSNTESSVHFLPTTSSMTTAIHGRRANASVPTNNNITAHSTSRIEPVVVAPSHAASNVNSANNNSIHNNKQEDDDDDPLAWLNDDADGSNTISSKQHNGVTLNTSNGNYQGQHETGNKPFAITNTNVVNGSTSVNPFKDSANDDNDDPLAFLEVKPAVLTHSETNVSSNNIRSNVSSSNALEIPWEINEWSSSQPHKTAVISREEELKAKKEEELRKLRATLTALTNEVQQKEEALSRRQEKEEAALLELEVKVCDRQNVIAEESHKAEVMSEETKRDLLQRKAEIAERMQKELKEQEEQMRREGELRYHRQLEMLFHQINEVEGHVTKLREERDLIMQRAPFSMEGVRLRLHKTVQEEHKQREESDKSTIHTTGTLAINAEGSSDNNNDVESNSKSDYVNRLDQAVAVVVELLQSCCHQRVDVMRKDTVDFIHNETLNVSGAIHNSRVAAFRNECNEHKLRLERQVNDTIANHRAFMKERQERNEAKLQSLRSSTESAIAELNKRQELKQEQLWSTFKDKVADMTTHFNTSAQEASSLFETKATQMLLNNKNAAQAERAKLEKRFELEERVQRQLFQSQENTLEEQLTRMHQLSEAESARQLASMEKGLAQSRLALETLANNISKLIKETDGKAESLQRELQQGTRNTLLQKMSNQVLSNEEKASTTSTATSKEIEELEHINQSLLHELEKRTDALSEQKSEITNSQLRLLHMIDDECVQMFQSRQAAQHAAECEQNFIRTSWEKAYLQQLSMPFSLNIPVHVPHHNAHNFLERHNSPSSEHIAPFVKNNNREHNDTNINAVGGGDGSANNSYLPITTSNEVAHTSVQTYSPPALMTATALLDVIVTQLEEKTALETECRNEIASHMKRQVLAVKELQTRSDHLHRSWIALLEQLHQLDNERETVHQQLTHVAVETVKTNSEREKLKVEQEQLEQRRRELAQELTLCQKEKKQVQVEYKDHIHQIRHMQLKMLCGKSNADKTKWTDPYALPYKASTATTSHSSREIALHSKLKSKWHGTTSSSETLGSDRNDNKNYKYLSKVISRTSTPAPLSPSTNMIADNDVRENVSKIATHGKQFEEMAHLHHSPASQQNKTNFSHHRTASEKQEEYYKRNQELHRHHRHRHHTHNNSNNNNNKRRNTSIYTSINGVQRDHSGKRASKSVCSANDVDMINCKGHKHKHKLSRTQNKHTAMRTSHSSRIHSSHSAPAAITSSSLTIETASVQKSRKPRANSSSSSYSNSYSSSFSSGTESFMMSSMQLLPPPPPSSTIHRVGSNHDNNNKNNASLHERVRHTHALKQGAAKIHHRRAASMHSCGQDESLCSSSSVYRVTSFTDLLPLADSTNTSACTAQE